jgi:hypothetical protein
MKTFLVALTTFFALYLGSYLTVRDVWAQESSSGRIFVVYPHSKHPLYLLFRPMSYWDQSLTGRGTTVAGDVMTLEGV